MTLLEMQRAAIEWFNRCMYSAVDHQFMGEALAEAQKALYLSNPNPRVGCVIVKDGEIIGRGFEPEKVTDAIEKIIETYLGLRLSPSEIFLDAYRRVGPQPFKLALYGNSAEAA